MTNARTIAKALGGKYSNGGWTARCPAHDDRTPSLAIRDSGMKTLFRCHAGCSQAAVLAARRSRDLWQSADRLTFRARPEPVRPREQDTIDRTLAPISIWCEAGNIDDTPGMAHLIRRGADPEHLPPELHRVLRWHPRCPWECGRQGCMLALFTDVIKGMPRAIHRTAITAAGEKIGRKVLGPMAGCVIRLWPDEMIGDGLILGEGIETTLAAATRIQHRGTYLRPAWATGSAGSMAKFPVLPGVEALTLLVDNDASGTGQKAANECSARWTDAGREVFRMVPNVQGDDFADIIGRVA